MHKINRGTISVAIMAHPRRAAQARQLASKFEMLEPMIVLDPEPDGPPSAVRTARLAWARATADASHHLVLQEDVDIPTGFEQTLMQAVSLQRDKAIMLSAEWSSRTGQAVRAAAFSGANWAPLRNTSLWAAGVVLPSRSAIEFSRYLQGLVTERDSAALLAFADERGLDVVIPVPNLIQHDSAAPDSMWERTADQGPRRSTVYLADVTPALFVNDEIADLSTLPYIPCDHLSSFVHTRRQARAFTKTRATDYQGGDYIASIGHTQETFSAMLMPAVREHASDYPDISSAFLLQVYITAFLLGYEMRDMEFTTDRVHSQVADEAARTMISGALKRIVSASTLASIASKPPRLVHDAFSRGKNFVPANTDPNEN